MKVVMYLASIDSPIPRSCLVLSDTQIHTSETTIITQTCTLPSLGDAQSSVPEYDKGFYPIHVQAACLACGACLTTAITIFNFALAIVKSHCLTR
jgi:hypothetical protein